MKASLDRFGRIVIPKKMRENQGLEPGDHVEIEEISGGLLLKPEPAGGDLHVREGVLIYEAQSSGDIDRALDWNRKDRLDKLGSVT